MKNARHAAAVQKNRRPRGRKPYSKKVRGLVIAAISLLCVLALLLIGGGIYLWVMFSRVVYDGEVSDSFVDSLIPDDETGLSGGDLISDYTIIDEGAANVAEIPVRQNTKSVTNILLVGVDSRAATGNGAYTGRSDTAMILTINTKNKTIKLTSILRDLLVTIPGRDWNGDGKDDYAKFNSSFAYGGFDLLAKTIEQNFRLKIDKYIAVNFAAFSSAVDAMDGVDIELTAAEARIVKVGSVDKTYHLTGAQALTYSRIRKLDSDFGRTNRQRKMITALFTRSKTMSIGKLNGILYEVLPQVRTNMSASEFMSFTTNSLTYFGYTMNETFHLPPDGEYTGKSMSGIGSVLVLNDPADAVTKLHQFIYNS